MKRTLLFSGVLVYFVFLISPSFAQPFNIGDYDGMTILSCSGVLSSGQGDYGNNEDVEVALCPDAGQVQGMSLELTSLGIHLSDQLCVYDGLEANSPLIDCFNSEFPNEQTTFRASAGNPSGCLTVRFISDAEGSGTGFEFSISCATPCQKIEASIIPTSPVANPLEPDYIDICPGDMVTFNADVSFPENGQFYGQSLGTSEFRWNFGDDAVDQGEGMVVSHVYDEPGGYIVQLEVTDENGCVNMISDSVKIRVAPTPEFNDLQLPDTTITYGEMVLLVANADPEEAWFLAPTISSDFLPLPDAGGNVSFSSDIIMTGFPAGDTLASIDDLIAFCLNIEHSWLHDIGITLTCPSGNEVILTELINPPTTNGAGQTFLGVPNDPDDCNAPETIDTPWGCIQPGEGALYCWSDTSSKGTWREYATQVDPPTLPSDTYNPFTPLEGLVGCPLNGTWTITVIDNWAIDNGFIFDWNIAFAPGFQATTATNVESFEPQVVFQGWEDNLGIVANNGDSLLVSPPAGEYFYHYTVTNEFGCTYDTIAKVNVLPLEPCLPVTLSGEVVNETTAGALNGSIDLTVSGGAAPFTFYWSNGEENEDIADLQAGAYSVTIVDANGCTAMERWMVAQDDLVSTFDIRGLERFDLVPNPARNTTQLTLEFDKLSDTHIQIVNVLGEEVYSEYQGQIQLYDNVLDLSKMDAGVYFVRIKVEDRIAARQLVVF